MALLGGGVAWAHRPGLSTAEITDDALVLTFSADELSARFPFGVAAEARDLLAAETLARAQITQASGPCEIGAARLTEVSGGEPAPGAAAGAKDGVALSAALTCPDGSDRTYQAGFLDGMEQGHRHLVSVDGEPVAVLDAAQRSASLGPPRDPGAPTRRRITAALAWAVPGAALITLAALRWRRRPGSAPRPRGP